MKKKLLALALVLVLGLTGCSPSHSGAESVTSTGPESGETLVETLGETPGEALEEALGHDWIAADCEHPETCSRCGETRGEALGHEPGPWESVGIDTETVTETLVQKCSRCGLILEKTDEPLISFCRNGRFILSPRDFTELSNAVMDRNLDPSFEARLQEDTVICSVTALGDELAVFQFAGLGEVTPDSRNLTAISVDFSGDEADAALLTLNTVMALNPTLDMDAPEGDTVTDLLVRLWFPEDGSAVGSGDYADLHYASRLDGERLHLEMVPLPRIDPNP